ncbi:hypothetical protein KM043_013567 [Ampulex compressa]|nr:hypothetical protein KM043_013567 [Ampulex compressa]
MEKNHTLTEETENFNRCFNCFRLGHLVKTCPSSQTCRQLQTKAPFALAPRTRPVEYLHKLSCNRDYISEPIRVEQCIILPERRVDAVSNHLGCSGVSRTILPTTSVLLWGASGRSLKVRALDQGSPASFIAQSAVQVLLPVCKFVSVLVTGTGTAPPQRPLAG